MSTEAEFDRIVARLERDIVQAAMRYIDHEDSRIAAWRRSEDALEEWEKDHRQLRSALRKAVKALEDV